MSVDGGGRPAGERDVVEGVRRPEESPRHPGRAPRRARPRRAPGRGARLLGVTGTRRAAVLAIVVCALALTVAVPLRTYLAQRSEVVREEQRQQDLREQVRQLERRKAELADPEQVRAEARQRLRYVMPGETPYVVQFPGEEQQRLENQQRTQATEPAHPWYDRLWQELGRDGR